jgi:hypothetical protein
MGVSRVSGLAFRLPGLPERTLLTQPLQRTEDFGNVFTPP